MSIPFARGQARSNNQGETRIPTTNGIPINVKQYRHPPHLREELAKQIDQMKEDDIIEESESPYNSPIWIVPKKPDAQGNKRWRLVIDFRSLNERTIASAYPLPNLTEILDQLGSSKYFLTLDLASGFHQVAIDPDDAPKTAFSTPFNHFQYKRMAIGLKGAPATFQALIDRVLSGLQGVELFVYMGDVVLRGIFKESYAENEPIIWEIKNCRFNFTTAEVLVPSKGGRVFRACNF